MVYNSSSCPLDCYDSCRIILNEDEHILADSSNKYTDRHLCNKLMHFFDAKRITTPMYNGVPISMDDALLILESNLKNASNNEILYYRGSGNVGLMQRVTQDFFAEQNYIGVSGSLCDGAGEAGIISGRGKNLHLDPDTIASAEVVIVWGRNIEHTNEHLLKYLDNKIIIVIDPIRTTLAQKADLHIQIKPRCDLHLALLLSRFAMIEGLIDTEYCESYASDYEEFYELTQSLRIKSTLESIDVSLGQIGDLLSLVTAKKTVILVGVGVQKYRNGDEVLRAIDAFAVLMGWFGKKGSGVSYLGNSTENLTLPFADFKHFASKPTVDFSHYKVAFIQGGNPLEQMPASLQVKDKYEKVPLSVYFGLYENETSKASSLIIPAKTFLEKNDFRSSYGDYSLEFMPKLADSEIGISEYELTKRLFSAFEMKIKSEEEYLEIFKAQIEYISNSGYRQGSKEIPYENGFFGREFIFMDEAELGLDSDDGYHLITSKYQFSLNSQFKRPSGIYMHPDVGFKENQIVKVTSQQGSATFPVKYDTRLRQDSVLIYSGTPGVNILTPSLLSYEGESAVFQEYKVKVDAL